MVDMLVNYLAVTIRCDLFQTTYESEDLLVLIVYDTDPGEITQL